MTEHVDIEVLAEYAEGLLDSEESRRVARHLDGCERCEREHAALGDVSSLLAAAPPPVMPPEVASRVEAAIDAEAYARQTATATAEAPGGNVVAMRSRRARRWIAPLSAVAAAAVVVVGGVTLVNQVNGHGGAQSGAAPTSESPAEAVPKAAGPRFTDSGTHYTATALAAQVNGTVRKSAPGGGLGAKSDKESPGPSRLPSALPGCVDRISEKAGDEPTVVDRGTYDGDPVRVLIFPHSGDKYAVWIVDSQCSAHADGIVTHTTVPRRP